MAGILEIEAGRDAVCAATASLSGLSGSMVAVNNTDLGPFFRQVGDLSRQVEAARVEYARRRNTFSRALAERGLVDSGTDGINVWVAVADERSALVQLAAQGIGVAPGEPFMVNRNGGHLRITIGLVDGTEADIKRLASQVASAAGVANRRYQKQR